MFLDMPGGGAWPPERPERRRVSARGEKVLIWLIAVNGLLLLVAPIGGATLITGLIALFR